MVSYSQSKITFTCIAQSSLPKLSKMVNRKTGKKKIEIIS